MKKLQKLAEEIRDSMQGWERDLEGHLESINDILNKHAPIEKPFPKVMVDIAGLVIYFYCNGNGRVLLTGKNNNYYVGYHNRLWNMSTFKDCEIQVKP